MEVGREGDGSAPDYTQVSGRGTGMNTKTQSCSRKGDVWVEGKAIPKHIKYEEIYNKRH